MHISAIRKPPNDQSTGLDSQPIIVRGKRRVPLRSFLSKIVSSIQHLTFHGPKEHVRFVVAAVRRPGVFLKLADPPAGGALERLVVDRPRYLSLLISPYMDARWSSAERVDRLVDHASTLRGPLRKYGFSVFQSLHLLDLNEIGIPDHCVIIDKPEWFCHEGLITLNLCKNSYRLFSVTFSFYREDAAVGIMIGGLQGRKRADILRHYRDFTKLALGLRPRDFLLEFVRIIARAENVVKITGVPDRFRYHRHDYFASNHRRDLLLDYDEVWKDRGGELNTDGLFEIPVSAYRKIDLIPSRKRSLRRRRYDLLDQLEDKVGLNLKVSVPVDCIALD